MAFITMGPQRQTAATLAPIPTPVIPRQGSLATPTPAPTPTSQPGQKPPKQFPTPTPIPENTPIYIETSGHIIPNYEWGVSQAESAIIGVVKSKLPARWNTPDGKRPPIWWGLPGEKRVEYGIFTPFVVEVQRYLYKPQMETEIIVAMAGGQVGIDSQKAGSGDAPVFEVGQRFLAFVDRHPDPGMRDTVRVDGKVFWIPAFKHDITAEGRARNRWMDLPLDEVVRRIEAAAANKR